MEKLEWFDYPMVKNVVCLFILTKFINVTDGWTPHDGIGRVYA